MPLPVVEGGSSATSESNDIVRVRWESRTVAFANKSVQSIIQEAFKHFSLRGPQSDLVLLAELGSETVKVTNNLLQLLPKPISITLSRIQGECKSLSSELPPAHRAFNPGWRIYPPTTLNRMTQDSMDISIKRLNGTTITLTCRVNETIRKVKAKVEDMTGITVKEQFLLFTRRELEDDRMLSDYNIKTGSTLYLNIKFRGGKPVIYLFPPTPIPDATVSVSIVPQWSFSNIYPLSTVKQMEDGHQCIAWSVSAQPDGMLIEKKTNLELSYLFWEAESNPSLPSSPSLCPIGAHTEQFDPAYPMLDCDTPTAVLLPFSKLLPYLDAMLKKLSLPTSARNDFITYWLPKLSKRPFVALRFLPQATYVRVAKLDINPKPDVVTRIFMLFRGISAEDAAEQMWSAARARVGEVDWVKVVGVQLGAWDESRFRVLEWGAMEVL